mgnify:CR=1 FL=1
MNMVSDFVDMMRSYVEAQHMGFIYGELYEVNSGAERTYPCVVLQPIDMGYDATMSRGVVRCRTWIVDQVLVDDDTERALREDSIRTKAVAAILAIDTQTDARFRLSDRMLRLQSYTGNPGVDALIGIRIDFDLVIHNCV